MLSAEELDLHVNGCSQNRRESQKLVYEAFFSFALGICERYAGTRDEAVEVLNDGFLKVFREIHQYKPAYADTVASFKGWLKKIMVYTAIDHYRKQKKHAIVTSLDAYSVSLNGATMLLQDKIGYNEIILMIQKLSPAYRTVLNLFIVEGYSHEEIANRLDISVGTSKSNLAKARKQLQKIIFKENQVYLERNATG